jgi:hypothetical protein
MYSGTGPTPDISWKFHRDLFTSNAHEGYSLRVNKLLGRVRLQPNVAQYTLKIQFCDTGQN